jgi:AbrB family looped-hinge helix DNA binding protein
MSPNMKVPEGKFISTVKVGEKGQIVIPKGARDLFDIKPGDTLLLLADKDQGIAIVQNAGFLDFANAIFSAQKKTEEDDEK